MARTAKARSWSTRRIGVRLEDEDWERLDRLGEPAADWGRGPFCGQRWVLREVVGPALQAYESLVVKGRVDPATFKRWLANVGREEPGQARAQFFDAVADLVEEFKTANQAVGAAARAVERAAAEEALTRTGRGQLRPVASFHDRPK